MFTLTNGSGVTVRETYISCNFYNDNRDFWGRGRWNIFAALKPGQSETYVVSDTRYIPHNAIADQTTCKIVDLSITGSGAPTKDSDH